MKKWIVIGKVDISLKNNVLLKYAEARIDNSE